MDTATRISSSGPADKDVGTGSRAEQRQARREQLLAAAATIVADKGLGGLTMEGLAAQAGVSKALPYRHFANADEALLALYQHEVSLLVARVVDAVDGVTGDDLIRAAVSAYLDAVEARGPVLVALAGPGSTLPDVAEDGQRQTPAFVADLITQAYGITGTTATVLAGVVTGAVVGASDSLGRGDANRATVEQLTVTAVIGALTTVAGTTGRGGSARTVGG